MADTNINRALLSVTDKTGLAEFANFLHDNGVELLSTGGTAKTISDAGIQFSLVSDYYVRVRHLGPQLFEGNWGGFIRRGARLFARYCQLLSTLTELCSRSLP